MFRIGLIPVSPITARSETLVIIVLLDAKSAFDVVDPYHLLRRLYQTGINDKL
jgi:hypothetical protein